MFDCEAPRPCVFCPEVIPQCDPGCEDCQITDGDCTQCPSAMCMDDCVMCTQEVKECEEGCVNCQIKPQTCDTCAMAVCKDGTDDMCKGKECGVMCGDAHMCDGNGMCVFAEMNPCSKHGCDDTMMCGDSCLMGDIMGWCDAKGECVYDGMPMCPRSGCPQEEPMMGGACRTDNLSCEYGEECCCGECHASRRFDCFDGMWAMLHTDACMRPNCCTTRDGGFVIPGESVDAGDGCNTCTCNVDDNFNMSLMCTEIGCQPEYSCAIKPGTTDTACGSKCCGKQDQVGLTCYYDEDTETCMDGVMPTEPPSMYADCVIEGQIFKKGQRGKAKKAKDAEECYDKCAKDKKCKAYAFTEGKKKGKCALFSKKAKTKKMKDSENTYSAKSNCHPYDGKQRTKG